MDCPFCNPDPERVFFRSHDLFCMWDGYPISEGHALVVTCRHVSSWFDATKQEQLQMLEGIKHARQEIAARYQPDAFNIGVNVGETAGQTVPHLHVHVIPRYRGDVPDPRGGVRHIIPGKGNYQSASRYAGEVAITYEHVGKRPMIFGSDERPFLNELVRDLEGASRLDLAVAFVTVAGVQQLESYLTDFFERNGRMRLLTGDYLGVTEPRALHRF